MKVIDIIDEHTIDIKVDCNSLQYEYLRCIYSEKDIDALILSNVGLYVKSIFTNLKGFELCFDQRIVYLHNNILYITYIDISPLTNFCGIGYHFNFSIEKLNYVNLGALLDDIDKDVTIRRVWEERQETIED